MKRLILIFLFSPIFIFASIPLDTNEYYMRILEIGHFNDDNAQDTLIGAATNNLNFKPRFIYWGTDTTSSIPDSLKKEMLEIVYPDWAAYRVASNIDFLNDDTLKDIGLYIWGNYSDTTYIDETNARDTIINVALFGQKGLDTLETIDLAAIDTFQISPFVAMHMRFNHEFTEPKYRDLSGSISYVFNTIELDVSDTSTTPPPIIEPTNIVENDNYKVKIYPNPAVYYANLEIKGLEAGYYNVNIFNDNGSIVLKTGIDIQSKGELFKQLDLTSLTSGLYFLMLQNEDKRLGPFQFILVK